MSEFNFDLKYKEEIESIKDLDNFEELGDEKYLNHQDENARILWAFYRPSGSHISQLQDKTIEVSIMAFNHSRLTPLKRFSNVNKEVIENEKFRNKIRNRARMLFRALVDDDLSELVEVLNLYPIYLSLACNQLINGRRYFNTYADLTSASKFLKLANNELNDECLKAFYEKLPQVKNLKIDKLKEFLQSLTNLKLNEKILNYYKDETNIWLEKSNLAILQKKAIENLVKKV